jgi:hypothetical protein
MAKDIEMTASRRTRPRRSAATAYGFFHVFGKLTREAIAADIAAVDEGVALCVFCQFRGSYGRYPRRFSVRMADLFPDVIAVRPFWSSLDRRVFPVTERITEAHVRPRNLKTDWNIRATGLYAENGAYAHIGMEVITCRTGLGVLELAVLRPDVPVVLRYLNRQAAGPGSSGEG